MFSKPVTIDDLLSDLKDGYLSYYLPDDDEPLFTVHLPTLNSFKMTREERALGLKLCLEARLNGGWKGDILKR